MSLIHKHFILGEVIIAFSVFCLFFVIFMNYFFTDYETGLIKDFVKESASFYKPLFIHKTDDEILTILFNNSKYYKDLIKQKDKENDTINIHNTAFDKKFIVITSIILSIIIILYLIPIVFGWINKNDINITYFGISFICHLIMIVVFELFLFWLVIPLVNPVKIYKIIP